MKDLLVLEEEQGATKGPGQCQLCSSSENLPFDKSHLGT